MDKFTNYDILQLSSPNHSSRDGCPIVGIIAHCIGTSLADALKILASDEFTTSAHYFIPQITGQELQHLMPEIFGTTTLRFPQRVPVIQLVPDEEKAWHAGISQFGEWNQLPGCEKGLNACTIGIEFHAPGYALGDGSDLFAFTTFTSEQEQTGIALMADITQRYGIPTTSILAHSTIAVGRKTDPGPLFFWQALYENGLGYLPQPKPAPVTPLSPSSIQFVQSKLLEVGFTQCSQTGDMDIITQQCIDAYRLQYLTTDWQSSNQDISQDLLDSLYGFDVSPIYFL